MKMEKSVRNKEKKTSKRGQLIKKEKLLKLYARLRQKALLDKISNHENL